MRNLPRPHSKRLLLGRLTLFYSTEAHVLFGFSHISTRSIRILDTR